MHPLPGTLGRRVELFWETVDESVQPLEPGRLGWDCVFLPRYGARPQSLSLEPLLLSWAQHNAGVS